MNISNSRRNSLLRTTALTAAALTLSLASAPAAMAQDSTYQGTSGGIGNYNSPANWNNGVPDAAGETATLDDAGTAQPTVDLGGVTVSPDDISITGSTDYTIQNGTFSLGGDNDGVLFNSSGSSTISANIVGNTRADLDVRGGGTLTLSGTNSGIGNVVVNNATLNAGSGTSFLNGFNLNVGNGSIDLGGTSSTWNSMIFQNATVANGTVSSSNTLQIQNADISAVIGGTGGIRTVGNGTITLSGANTYTGDTEVTVGTVRLGADNVIPDASNLVITGGTFDLDGFSDTIANLSGTGGTIDFGNSGLLTVVQSTDATYAGDFTGSSSFNTVYFDKLGTGTLTLSGNSSVTGAGNFDVRQGTVRVSGGNAVGDESILGLVPGATFELLSDETVGALSAAGGSIVLNGNRLTIDGVPFAIATFVGTISGSGGLTLTDANGSLYTQSITSAQTYTGSTIVTGSTLQLTGAGSLASTDIQLTGGTLRTDGGAFSNAADISQTGGFLDIDGNETIASLTITGGTNDFTGATIRVTTATISDVTLNGGTIRASNTITFDNVVVNSELSGFGDVVIDGGTTVFNAVNGYFGPTTINQGTLRMGVDDAIRFSDVILVDGTLDLDGFDISVGSISGTGGTIDIGNSGSILNFQGSSKTYAGNWTGTSTLGQTYLTLDGDQTFTLSGTSDITGGGTIRIEAGRIAVSGGNAIGDDTLVSINPTPGAETPNGTFELLSNETIGGLDDAGDVFLNNNVLTLAGLGAGTSALYSGSIQGTGNLVVNSATPFTQTLTGANAFTGSTTVTGGTLALTGGGSLASTTILVDGGTLLTDGGAFALGAGITVSAGALQVAGDETIDALSVSGGQATIDLGTTLSADTISTAGSGQIENAGTLVSRSGAIQNAGNLVNTGTITGGVANSGTATNSGRIEDGVSNTGSFTSTGTIVGSFANSGGTANLSGTIDGALTNDAGGAIFVTNDLAITNQLAQTGGSSLQLQAGTLDVGGAVQNGDGTNASTITVSGGAILLADSVTNAANASLINAGSVNLVGPFSNAGNVFNSGSIASLFFLNNGTLQSTGNVASSLTNNGAFSGSGLIGGDVVNGDASSGQFTVTGDLQVDGSFSNANGSSLTVQAGTLSIDNGLTNAAGSTVTNAGTIVAGISNSGAIESSGLITGAFDNQSGASFTNSGTLGGSLANAGTASNLGTITGFTSNTGSLTSLGSIAGIDNTGTLRLARTLGGDIANSGTGTVAVVGDLVSTGDLASSSSGNVDILAGNASGFGTIALTGTGQLNIGSGTSLTSNMLSIGADASAFNQGTISTLTAPLSNAGALTNTGTIANGIANSGTFDNQGSATGGVSNSGTLQNTGTIARGVTNYGTFDNQGTVTGGVFNTGALANGGSIFGGLTNSGSFAWTGLVSGPVLNFGGGSIAIDGTTVADSTLTNSDSGTIVVNGAISGITSFTNSSGAPIGLQVGAMGSFSTDAFTNQLGGTVLNQGAIVASGSALQNAGTFQNDGSVMGDLDNAGLAINNGSWTGSATNSGALTNSGAISGAVSNTGTLASTGTIGGALTNSGNAAVRGGIGGDIANSGTLEFTGDTTADGTFTNTATGSTSVLAGRLAGLIGVDNSGALMIATGTEVSTAALLNRLGGLIRNDGSIESGSTIENDGEFANNGAIDSGVANTGTFDNAGSIAGDVENSGTLASTGAIGGALTNNSYAEIEGSVGGAIDNADRLVITGNTNAGGTLTNRSGASAAVLAGRLAGLLGTDNSGALSVAGGAELSTAALLNRLGAAIDNQGTIASGSQVENDGTLANSGTISGEVDNRGTLASSGTIEGGLDNTGTTALSGTLLGAVSNSGTGTIGVLGGLVGDGSVTNSGSAQLVVDGGDYTGVTDLDNSSDAAIGVGIAAGSGLFTQRSSNAAGSTLVVEGTLGASDLLTNAGTFWLNPGGTLIGNSLQTGGLTVLNGTQTGVMTMTGGRLQGTGTLGGLDVQGGTVAPGNSIGTLNVVGDVAFATGSTYEVETAADLTSDRIVATGTADITGGLVDVITLDPYQSYAAGSEWAIVTADGGVSGGFDGVQDDSAFLNFKLAYDANNVYLRLERITNFGGPCATFNQQQSGAALDSFDQTPRTDSVFLVNDLLFNGGAGTCTALGTAAGEIYPALLADIVMSGEREAARLVTRAHRVGDEGFAIWGELGASIDEHDGDASVSGIDSDDTAIRGGFDWHGKDNAGAIGAQFGIVDGDLRLTELPERADYDGFDVGGYGRLGSSNAGATLAFSGHYSKREGRTTRLITFPTTSRIAGADIELKGFAMRGELRYGFELGGGWAAGPLASINYAWSKLAPYTETGAASLNLTGQGDTFETTRGGAGLFANFQGEAGSFDLTAEYLVGDDARPSVVHAMQGAPDAPFTSRSVLLDGSAIRIGAQSEVALGEGWSIGGNADATLGSGRLGASASVNLKKEF